MVVLKLPQRKSSSFRFECESFIQNVSPAKGCALKARSSRLPCKNNSSLRDAVFKLPRVVIVSFLECSVHPAPDSTTGDSCAFVEREGRKRVQSALEYWLRILLHVHCTLIRTYMAYGGEWRVPVGFGGCFPWRYRRGDSTNYQT